MTNWKSLYQDHHQRVKTLYESAMTSLGYDWMLIDSGTTDVRFLDDLHQPFRVNPHFNYWVPLHQLPDSYLIIRPGKKALLLYCQVTDFWYPVPEEPVGFWSDSFEIEVISGPEAIRKHLPENRSSAVYVGPAGVRFKEMGIKQLNPAHLLNRLHYPRAVKTGFEVACMKEATRSAIAGHQAARDEFFRGGSEFDCHLAYLKASQQMEMDLPYGNIVAINEHAATLHYPLTDKKPKPESDRHSFLLDAGASFFGYSADITRTYSYRKDEFADLVGAMDKEQLALIAQLKVGESYSDSQFRAHAAVGRLLNQFRFSDESADTLVETGVTSTFFPHGIGHLLGLQVHDIAGHAINQTGDLYPRPEGHPFLRLTRPIEAGFVFTIEPGLYFIDPLLSDLKSKPEGRFIRWDRVNSFRKYGGIRIEDNVLMTASGPVNLTRDHWT